MVSALCYALVNAGYVRSQNIAIYPGITWDNVVTLIVVPVALLGLLGSFFFGHIYDKKVKVPLIQMKQGYFLQGSNNRIGSGDSGKS